MRRCARSGSRRAAPGGTGSNLWRPGRRHGQARRFQPACRARQRAVQPCVDARGARLGRSDVRREADATAPARCARALDFLLLAGSVGLARPAFSFLPRVAAPPGGAGLPWRRALAGHCRAGNRHALSVALRADPFPAGAGRRLSRGSFRALRLADRARAGFDARRRRLAPPPRKVAAAAFAVAAYSFLGAGSADKYLFHLLRPRPGARSLIAALAVGALFYFLSDEWLTRGPGAARGAYPASKIAFLVSLAIAVALDFERLFFLTLIVPIIGLFFIIHGLFSAWAYRATGHPFVAGAANAIAAAWAIGVVFPLVAG